MSPKPGGMAAKIRPAVIVSREDLQAPRAVTLCVPLTTQFRGSLYEMSLGKLKFLDRESWANVQGLASVEYSQFGRRLGLLIKQQIDGLKNVLRFAMDL